MAIPLIKTKTLKPLTSAYYITTILVHVLILAKVVPYDWVNGGLSANYEAQAIQSIVSIVLLILMLIFALNVLRTVSTMPTWKRRVFYALTAFTVVSLIMQIIGTNFERFVLAPIVLTGLVLHLQVAVRLNSAKKPRGKLAASVKN